MQFYHNLSGARFQPGPCKNYVFEHLPAPQKAPSATPVDTHFMQVFCKARGPILYGVCTSANLSIHSKSAIDHVFGKHAPPRQETGKACSSHSTKTFGYAWYNFASRPS